MTYLPIPAQPTCGLAWLHAARTVNERPGHDANNVVLDIEDPVSQGDLDKKFIARIDKLIAVGNQRRRDNDAPATLMPVVAVANTIFPQRTYDQHGSPEFYDVYMKTVLPRLKTGDFGRYFDRLVEYPHDRPGGKSRAAAPIRPLQDLIERMKKNLSGIAFRNAYEINVYDPVRDARNTRIPCLSFLSFKIGDEKAKKLHLTALYRNHYYISRLLGNLMGLGRLIAFVASEIGLKPGALTVISAHAVVDEIVSRSRVDKLLKECSSL
jgi:hypothetical protein